jgi:hypothetical protein
VIFSTDIHLFCQKDLDLKETMVSSEGLIVSPRNCGVPGCVWDGVREYQLQGWDEKAWLCEEHTRLAQIADFEDGTVLNKDG